MISLIESIAYMISFLTLYLAIKNVRTYCVRRRISRAIYKYRQANLIHYNRYVDYNCMETCEKTLFRLWDWGYKRIVPKEIYNIIKDYIK